MLNIKVWTMSLGCWMAATFTICVLGGVIAPDLPIPASHVGIAVASVQMDLMGLIRAGPR